MYLQITVNLSLNKPGNRTWGVEVELHLMTSALHGSQMSASRPGRFTPEKSPTIPTQEEAGTTGNHRARGWVHPRGGSDRWQVPFPSRQSNAISRTLDPQDQSLHDCTNLTPQDLTTASGRRGLIQVRSLTFNMSGWEKDLKPESWHSMPWLG